MPDKTVTDQTVTLDLAVLSGPAKSPATVESLRVDGFDLLGMLGHGGMGVVYKAWQRGTNRPVALKMIMGGGAATPQLVSRFRVEGQAAARLNHRNIVQVYQVGEADGIPYIAMEYVDGPTLLDQLADQPQPPREAAELVRELAEAIQHAHASDIIHRDLKPGNVLMAGAPRTKTPGDDNSRPLLANKPVPKITDFGLAKFLDEDGGYSLTGDIVGTPSYMAPEQAFGEKNTVGPAADIYALGATLYCALTGRAVFKGQTKADTLDMVRKQEPVPVRRLQPKVPVDLETICLACLEKDPHKRYPSAQELADELGRFLRGEPIRRRPIGWPGRLWRWCLRNPPLAASIAFAIGCVLSLSPIAIFFAIQARQGEARAIAAAHQAEDNAERADREARRALEANAVSERRRYAANMNLAFLDWKQGRIGEVLRRLAEEELTNSGAPNFREFEWYYLQLLAGLDLRSWKAHQGMASTVAFSPDGRCLASGGEDGAVRIWSTATGEKIFESNGPRVRVTSVAFSPDGQHVAYARLDGAVEIWQFASKQPHVLQENASAVWSAAYSPDGKWLASGGGDYAISIWEAATGKKVRTLSTPTGSMRCVRFSPDGKRLAVGGLDGTVRLWEPSTGAEIASFSSPQSSVTSLAFRPDGRHLATRSRDGALRLWDIGSRQQLFTLRDHSIGFGDIAFSPDGQRLASASQDCGVRVWDLTNREQIVLLGTDIQVSAVTYSPDGKRIACATVGGCIKLWDATSLPDAWEWQGHTDEVLSIDYDSEGKRLASGGKDYTVRIWDPVTGDQTLELDGHTGPVTSTAFAGSERLASASEDQTVRLWNIRSGKCERILRGHTGAVRAVACARDGRWLASGGDDGTIRIWDGAAGNRLATLEGLTGKVLAVAISPDGRLLAWGGGSDTVRIWSSVTRQVTAVMRCQVRPITSLAFSSDSKRLASAERDYIVELWDMASSKRINSLRSLAGSGHYVEAVTFSPSGNRVVSTTLDGTVSLRDAETGDEVLTLKNPDGGPARSCPCVRFSPDGRQLACAGPDWQIRVWDSIRITRRLGRVERPVVSCSGSSKRASAKRK
jgi:WD40 repeat protein